MSPASRFPQPEEVLWATEAIPVNERRYAEILSRWAASRWTVAQWRALPT